MRSPTQWSLWVPTNLGYSMILQNTFLAVHILLYICFLNIIFIYVLKFWSLHKMLGSQNLRPVIS